MDVALALVLPGLVGGILLAVLLGRLNRRPSSGVVRKSTLEPISPDVINMAHIRVAGVGGLSMIAAGVIIAVYLPEIGLSLLAALLSGAALAVVLIIRRSEAAATGDGGIGTRPPGVLPLNDDLRRVGGSADEGMSGQRASAIA